jgi:hypothetical protein
MITITSPLSTSMESILLVFEATVACMKLYFEIKWFMLFAFHYPYAGMAEGYCYQSLG